MVGGKGCHNGVLMSNFSGLVGGMEVVLFIVYTV